MAIPVDVLRTGAQFDADTYSLKYFGVSENFTRLKRGKNTITLSPSIYLKKESPIEVELYIVDESGREISYPVEFPNKVTKNGTTYLEVNITDDVPLANAIFYIAGIMVINVDTGETMPDTTKYNLVWKGFSRLVENEDDELSPCSSCNDTVLDGSLDDVTVEVTPEDCTYREPASDRNTLYTGAGTITYFSTTETSQTNSCIQGNPRTISNKALDTITNSTDSLSGISEVAVVPDQNQPLPIINSTQAEFTADMVGSILTVNTPDISSYVPGDVTGPLSVGIFSTTIVEVINNKTVRVNGFFKYNIPATATRGSRVITQFKSTDYTIRYSKDVASTAGQKVTGCAKLCFENVATSNGQIAGVQVKAKPVGGLGGAVDLGVFTPNYGDKLEDTSNYEYDPVQGAKYKSAGAFKSQSDVTTYLEVKDYKEKSTASSNLYTKDYEYITDSSATQNDGNIINAASVDEPSSSEVRLVSIKDSYLGAAKANTEYTLQFDLFSTQVSNKKPEIEVYIQGPALDKPANTTPFGTYLETFTSDDGKTLKNQKITFKTTTSSNSIKPYFLIKAGKWDVGNVKITPDSSTKNSPNEFCITVPLDGLATNVIGQEFIFEIDFIGSNGKPLNLNLHTQNIILNQNATIDENLIINTFNSSTLLQNIISGSGAWDITDGSTTSTINSGDTLTILGTGVSLSGQTLTITGGGASNCTITLQGDGTGIDTVIGDFTLDQTSNETLTISHKDTSTLLGSYGTNGISSITVDSLGHVTAISTATYCTTDTNNYVCGISFNTTNGCLTLNRLGLPDLSACLDGRYCTTGGSSITITNSANNRILTADGSQTNINAESALTFDDVTGTLCTTGVGGVCVTYCVSADNFITTSDIRLKSDIREIKDSIDVLKKFKSYMYNKSGYEDAGFIAQEVCKAIPYSVTTNTEGYLTMRDRPILAYLHNAVIELNSRIDCLESKIDR